MKRSVWGAGVLGCMLVAGCLGAQQTQTIDLNDNDVWHGRSFLLKLNSGADMHQSGAWTGESRLRDYARQHTEENFLLFEQAGVLYRLDALAALAELGRLHAPLEELAAVQHDLAAVQAPLAEQQRALGEEMRATRNPAIMGRIGREQGSIGRRQGEIGREQGVIGRQQGVLGRAFYQKAQAMIDTCLREHSCPAVEPAAAQR